MIRKSTVAKGRCRGKKGIREMEKSRFRFNICGVEISVSGDVDENATRLIAEDVRSRMQQILNTAYAASVEKAAVLTALNLREELEGQRAELEALRSRTAELEEELSCARQAAPAVSENYTVQEHAVGERTPLKNPLRPDFGDETGLVSFFAKEDNNE